MTANKSLYSHVILSTSHCVEDIECATKEAVLVGSEQLFVPESVDVKNVLLYISNIERSV